MRCLLLLLATFLWMPPASAEDVESALFTALESAIEEARAAQLDLLTPQAWDEAIAAHGRARANFERNRSLETINRYIAASQEALARAHRAAPIARTTLGESLDARSDALSAGADRMAQKTWVRAEQQFRAAAMTLERGRSDRAQKQSAEALATFRAAELEAIQGAILIDVRELLAQAERDRVEKYAPLTLAAARQSLADAERFLIEDRYDTDRPRLVARQAREQASHALFLTAHLKAIDDDELTLEQALLEAEKPVLRIADALDITPDVSNGVAATTDAILAEVKRAQRQEAELRLAVDERNERISTLESALGGATQEAVALNSLLAEQESRRAQFEAVEALFDENEAEVLRTNDSVVIRLVGLNFASGEATIREEHFALLAKVQRAMSIYDGSAYTVEGHTDSFGSDALNYDLSQRRAEAVRAYLLSSSGLPEYRISAMGYGETRPIANNETSEGRAKNRRIDFVILRT